MVGFTYAANVTSKVRYLGATSVSSASKGAGEPKIFFGQKGVSSNFSKGGNLKEHQ